MGQTEEMTTESGACQPGQWSVLLHEKACHTLLWAGLVSDLGKNLQRLLQTPHYRQGTRARTHMTSQTWLTSEDVSGNEAFLPAPLLACLPVWASFPSNSSFRRQGLGLESLSTAWSLLPLPDHCLSEHSGIPAGLEQAQSL